jgi:molecular chaperone HtpG
MQAIWLKNKADVKQEEYNEFYKHISHDFLDPLETIHYKAEGTIEFTALLFIPSKKPFDIYYKSGKFGPALYVKKVQIMEACEELIPSYFRFIKGVVDSSDLPLNVSREMLQKNRVISHINKNITKKLLDTLKNMKKNEPEKYEKFYAEFGNILKEGIYTDFEKKEELASLMIFNTLNSLDKKTDLDNYISKMPEHQEEIYYIVGNSVADLKNSPHLEFFKEKWMDVILLTDEIDDLIMNALGEYNKKRLKSIVKGDIKLDEVSKKELEKKENEYKVLIDFLKEYLKNDVKDVRGSIRLKDSIACLVKDEFDIDNSMRRLLESMGQAVPESKKIFEINLDHPVVQKMKKLLEVDPKSSKVAEYAELLYDLALVVDGDKPKDIGHFTRKISELMSSGL